MAGLGLVKDDNDGSEPGHKEGAGGKRLLKGVHTSGVPLAGCVAGRLAGPLRTRHEAVTSTRRLICYQIIDDDRVAVSPFEK